jgi:hypothetical protein
MQKECCLFGLPLWLLFGTSPGFGSWVGLFNGGAALKAVQETTGGIVTGQLVTCLC